MNKAVCDAIDELIMVVKENSSFQDTSFQLFLNCEESEIKIRSRSPEDLERAGISMRNLRGEWIK